MKPRVYIETTIVSYLVATGSRDVIQSAHQEITRDWWERRSQFDLYVSRTVVAEARRGHPEAAARRVPVDVESSASRERGDPWQDRRGGSQGRPRSADHLHA